MILPFNKRLIEDFHNRIDKDMLKQFKLVTMLLLGYDCMI